MKKLDLNKLSFILSKKRKDKNMSQEQLSQLTNINRQVIGRIESGKMIPSLVQLEKILDVLNINFMDILEDEEEKDILSVLKDEVKTTEEKEVLNKFFSMIFSLKKHKNLAGVYNDNRN